MDNFLRINLDDLEFEELTYELVLRGIPVTDTIENQKRELRARMRNEIKNYVRVASFRTVTDEYKIVPAKLNELENKLNEKREPAYESRLYHYLERVARAHETNEGDRDSKKALLDIICEMIKIYFNREIRINEDSFEEVEMLGAVGGKNTTTSVENQEAVTNNTEKVPGEPINVFSHGTGTIPKNTRNSMENRNPITSKLMNNFTRSQQVSLTDSQSPNTNPSEFIHVSQIEDYISHCVNEILKVKIGQERLGNTTSNNSPQRVTNPGILNPPINRFPQPSMPQTSNQIGNYSRSVIPNNLQMPESVRRNMASPIRFSIDNRPLPSTRPVESGSNENYPRISNRLEDMLNYPRRQPHQTCNIVEKWPKFLGDSNPVPLVAFLRNVDILCRSYGIEKNELIRHAHLLFGGDASVWYTTYVDKFEDWEALVYYLTLRYDNPNRDRFIKEEMRNRKQKPTELFSAFLTDIESLAQRLIHKISEREKFEIVIDNMKMSYKRRLALHELNSIEELANMCYRFDALENSLYTARNKPYEVHNLDEEYDQDSDAEELNVIQKYRSGKLQASSENKTRNEKAETPTETLCWNCRDYGHFWKDCSNQKSIFCHVCGMVGKTTSTCPKNHPPFKLASENQKNLERDRV